jgi:hypothetical protein
LSDCLNLGRSYKKEKKIPIYAGAE